MLDILLDRDLQADRGVLLPEEGVLLRLMLPSPLVLDIHWQNLAYKFEKKLDSLLVEARDSVPTVLILVVLVLLTSEPLLLLQVLLSC